MYTYVYPIVKRSYPLCMPIEKHLSWTIFTCFCRVWGGFNWKPAKIMITTFTGLIVAQEQHLKNTLSCIETVVASATTHLYHHLRQLFSCERSFNVMPRSSQCKHKIQNEIRSMLCFLCLILCFHWKIRAENDFFFFFFFFAIVVFSW